MVVDAFSGVCDTPFRCSPFAFGRIAIEVVNNRLDINRLSRCCRRWHIQRDGRGTVRLPHGYRRGLGRHRTSVICRYAGDSDGLRRHGHRDGGIERRPIANRPSAGLPPYRYGVICRITHRCA